MAHIKHTTFCWFPPKTNYYSGHKKNTKDLISAVHLADIGIHSTVKICINQVCLGDQGRPGPDKLGVPQCKMSAYN